ncbi:MAG: DUF2344 domain-containing protein [Anaerolineales bacterium]|nr:DUF2344 domain-containing protein [Anaerolineales bacterium]
MSADQNPPQKVRHFITFAKEGALRFGGQLDLQRTFERTFRRAKLPLAYSQGFHPHPKINLGAALPLGIVGRCEIADIWLEQPIAAEKLLALLQAASPEGLRFIAARQVSPQEPAVQTLLAAAEYQIEWHQQDQPEDLKQRVEHLLSQPSILRERRGKCYDLLPLIEELLVSQMADGTEMLLLKVCIQPGKTGRPDEVLLSMDLDPFLPDITRIKFHYLEMGDRAEGLE